MTESVEGGLEVVTSSSVVLYITDPLVFVQESSSLCFFILLPDLPIVFYMDKVEL